MREIVFRGKRIDTGEWRYGDLVFCLAQDDSLVPHIFIATGIGAWDSIEVEPSTIGQYTGLKDENEVEIFEGDIVKDSVRDMEGLIRFVYGEFRIHWSDDGMEDGELCCWIDSIKVIDNIHDNPELLAGDTVNGGTHGNNK